MVTSFCTLGIDPAKDKFTLCLIGNSGQELKAPTDFEASRSGLDQMRDLLRCHVAKGSCLVVGIESSASLDDNLLAAFASMREEFTIKLIRVDAAQTRHFSGPRPIRSRTDKSDSRRIARFTRTYADNLSLFISDPQMLAMQRLINERLALAEDLVAQKNRLRDRLVISFPEYTQVFEDPCSPTSLAVMLKAPTAAHIVKHSASRLAAICPARSYGRKLGTARAEQLKCLASTSIASATSDDDGQTIIRLVERIELLRSQIEQIESRLEQFVSHADDQQPANDNAVLEQDNAPKAPSIARQIQLAISIPGLSLVSASAIVLRSQGIARFTSAKALSAQLAACPDRNQTGSSYDSANLSFRGDRRARVLGYLAAMASCRSDLTMAFHHWRLVQNGKTPKQATCACMNRMMRIVWHLVNTNQIYDPHKALNNARKHHPQQWETFVANQAELGKTIRKKLQTMLSENLK